MDLYLAIISFSRLDRRSPCRAALAGRFSSLTKSMAAHPAAQEIGLPPKVKMFHWSWIS